MKTEAVVSHLVKPNMLEHGDIVKFKTAEGYVKTGTVVNFPGMPFSANAINIGTRTKWETLHVTNVVELGVGPSVTGRECTMMFNAVWDDYHTVFKLYEQNLPPKEAIVDPKPFVTKTRGRFTGPKVKLAPKDLLRVRDETGYVHPCKLSSVPAKGERPNDYYFAVTQLTGPDTDTVVWVHAKDVMEIGKRDQDDEHCYWTRVEHSHHSLWDEFYEVVSDTYISQAMIGDATIRNDHKDATVTDYKGHKNLAEMIKGHLRPLSDALRSRQHYCQLTFDHDNAAYWAHELGALMDIEKAIAADLGEELNIVLETNVADSIRMESAAADAFGPQKPPVNTAYFGVDICGVVGCGKFKDDKARFCPNHTEQVYTLNDEPSSATAGVTFAELTGAQPTAQEERAQAWGGTITDKPAANPHTQRTALEYDTHIRLSLYALRNLLTDAVNVALAQGEFPVVAEVVDQRMYIVTLTHDVE